MCTPKAEKPEIIQVDNNPFAADEQINLATRISEETKRRRLDAFRSTISGDSRGVASRANTTRTVATGSL